MSLLSENLAHTLAASQTNAHSFSTKSVLPGQVNVSSASFQVTSTLVAGIYTVPLNAVIPKNAYVYTTVFDVIVSPAGSATNLGFGTVDSPTNLTGGSPPKAAFSAMWRSTASFVENEASSVVQVDVTGGNLTSGNIIVHVLWV